MMTFIVLLHDRVEAMLGERLFKIIRFLVSGGIAAASNLAIFFLLYHFGHLHYLRASIAAFILSIAVSFTLQKFWTFRDKATHDVHYQFARYAVVIGANLALNTILVYLFVEMLDMWPPAAQTLATALIAVVSYFAYRRFVFRDRPASL